MMNTKHQVYNCLIAGILSLFLGSCALVPPNVKLDTFNDKVGLAAIMAKKEYNRAMEEVISGLITQEDYAKRISVLDEATRYLNLAVSLHVEGNENAALNNLNLAINILNEIQRQLQEKVK